MLAVTVKIDEASIKEAQHILRAIPGAWPRVARTSLLRTVKHSRAVLARIIKSRIGGKSKEKAKVGDIKNYLHIKYPSFANLRTTLEVSKYTDPLIELDPSQTDKGVTYRMPFGGGRQLLRHGFIATGEKRGRQVWLRSRYYIGRAKMIDWKGRTMEAIYAQKAPSLNKYIKAEDHKVLSDDGAVTLVKEINGQIGRELKKWNKR